MRRLKRFLGLSGRERGLLIRVLMVVGAARASLWILPVEMARKVSARAAAGSSAASVEQVVWAVTAVSRCLPGATCLTQAIAAQSLLANSGFPSKLEVGVAKDNNELRSLRAHAWVVCHGQVVLGGRQVERYDSLMAWDQ